MLLAVTTVGIVNLSALYFSILYIRFVLTSLFRLDLMLLLAEWELWAELCKSFYSDY